MADGGLRITALPDVCLSFPIQNTPLLLPPCHGVHRAQNGKLFFNGPLVMGVYWGEAHVWRGRNPPSQRTTDHGPRSCVNRRAFREPRLVGGVRFLKFFAA